MTRTSPGTPPLWLAAFLGVSAPLAVLVGAMGSDVGWISFDTGFGFLTLQVGWWLSILATGLGLAVAGLYFRRLHRVWPWLVTGLAVPALTLSGFLWMKARADAAPPVHETASDWSEPLGFSRLLLDARGSDAWPVSADPTVSGSIGDVRSGWAQWAGRRVADINAETCPGARTVPRLASSTEVIAALEAEGVTVLGESPWRVEGSQASAFYGRARDVVVRMEPRATDIRVVERRGLVDLGETCGLATRIQARLSRPARDGL